MVLYAVAHQPRRLKLPAQPIPRGATADDLARCLFDERLDEAYFRKVARACYWPATEMFLALAREGARLSLGLSLSLVRQAERWDPALLDAFRRLVARPEVEPVCVEPHHGFVLLVDLERFAAGMHEAQDRLEAVLGRRPVVADTTEMCMSDPVYLALDRAGFEAAFLDGRPWVLGWREPSYLYHGGRACRLLARHHRLSDDVGYRFSNRTWNHWPLHADTYADWIAGARGDLVVLGWDYETFGEHHWASTGIFDFVRRLPQELERHGVRTLTASEAVAAHAGRSHELPLPAFPSTWAGSGGMEFFLGNPVQQAVFFLMVYAYAKARLTGDPRIVDLALWLMQSDHLHMLQWLGRGGSEAEVSAYFTPREWWGLGAAGLAWEVQQVYKHFIRALDVPDDRRPLPLPPPLLPIDPEAAARFVGA